MWMLIHGTWAHSTGGTLLPKVLNKRNGSPPGAIYIGRPSIWGNPYLIGKDGDRAQVIRKFKKFVLPNYSLDELSRLQGRDLLCFCAPLPCHGDVLLEAVNG